MILPLDGRTPGRTPEQHRAIVAKSGARRGDVLSWPTAERLRHDKYRLALLVRWRDLMEPPSVGGEPDPADDGRALVINRTDRPTVGELLAGAHRATFTRRRIARGVWEDPVRHPGGWWLRDGFAHLGDLLFRASELIQWGTDKHGQPLSPFEKLTLSSRGGRRRNVPGTRQRKAMDSGGDWDGLHRSPVVSLDDQRGADASDAMARAQEARIARRDVGPYHAEVLDLAISSSTAEEIGERFGYHGKYAERKGIRLVNEALDAFGAYVAEIQLAADNDNDPQDYIAEAA